LVMFYPLVKSPFTMMLLMLQKNKKKPRQE
jgi:hypothetical protein